jgi:type VI secretion system protein VasG
MSDIKALIGKLNPVCKRALETAAERCLSQTHFSIEIEHLLIQLVELPDGDVPRLLRYYEIVPAQVAAQLNQALERLKRGNSRTPALSPHLLAWLQAGWVFGSLRLQRQSVRSGALFAALYEDEGLRALVLESAPLLLRIPRGKLIEDLPELVRSSPEDSSAPAVAAGPAGPGMGKGGAGRSAVLDAYTIDLTVEAAAGKVDPIVGRDAEIRQIIDVLMRRRQNNPILTGEAGVGKTAIVEGFAQQIVARQVPPPLANVSVRILDLGLLQAGAGIRGEFENRLRGVIDEVAASPRPIVLFIDEAHTLIGAGGAAGQGDAANLLKPALARGQLRTIAATTWGEYKKYFEKDAALARRFQVIRVAEPSEEAASRMLRALLPRLERHHGVRVLDAAVTEAVRLSHRYIIGRQLPDKAISVLDTACARVAIARAGEPPPLQDAMRRAEILAEEIAILAREGMTGHDHNERIERLTEERARVEELRDRLSARFVQEKATVERIEALEREIQSGAAGKNIGPLVNELGGLRLELEALQEGMPMVPPHVDLHVVATVVSGWTGIPVGKMLAGNLDAVRALRERMTARIVGQDAALDAIRRRIQTFHADLGEPDKPAGVFLLVGPSGVGKTETAVTLADILYGGSRSMITINMSEYQEAHTVSGLKGAPPGYVGYGQGGVLTEAVRRAPYSVVLLDEVEKAHPDVMELFYQVFDKGILEDSEGQLVDFKNTIILLTSNIGSEAILELLRRRGRGARLDELVAAVRPALLRHFKPAFLGRLVVVPYLPLSDDELRQIVQLKLRAIEERVGRTHGAELSWDRAVIDAIVARCTETESGARTIDHLLTQTLLPELSEQVLDRLAERAEFDLIRIELDHSGQFSYAFSASPVSGMVREAAA